EKAKAKGLDKVVGSQEEAQELNSRIEEAQERANKIRQCEEDRATRFEVKANYVGLDPSYRPYIQSAIDGSSLKDLAAKYTDKPVNMNFALDGEGNPFLVVEMRFDMKKYKAWTKGRVPEEWKDLKVLSLEPYYALMQKLIYFRY